MGNQRIDCNTLSDRIAEKVQEYLDEMDSWNGDVFLWVDGDTKEVSLGYQGEEHIGFMESITQFITKDDDGCLIPDYDQIDDYAYSWFDYRQG